MLYIITIKQQINVYVMITNKQNALIRNNLNLKKHYII